MTGSSYLWAGGEPVLQKLANTALDILRADGHPEIPSFHMPRFEDLYPDDDPDSEFESYPAVKFDLNATSLIMHSSGQHVMNLTGSNRIID